MKNLLLVLVLAIGLYGCASIPEPRAATDALIIGNLVLDFPDGFLGQRARTVRSNIYLYFRNTTNGTWSWRLTSDGYFYFRGNGSDRYVLERYEYSYWDEGTEFYLSDKIGLSFSSTPGKLVYLGHLDIRYEKPSRSYRVTFARSTSLDDGGFLAERLNKRHFLIPRMHPTYWKYTRSDGRQWDDAAMVAFLRQKNPDSPWLERDIIYHY
jgi:hypothetical protein